MRFYWQMRGGSRVLRRSADVTRDTRDSCTSLSRDVNGSRDATGASALSGLKFFGFFRRNE